MSRDTGDETYDVVVVGGAGLAAATEAHQFGRAVLLVEKNPALGGSTAWSIGSITSSATPHQIKRGIKDCTADHWADMPAFAGDLALGPEIRFIAPARDTLVRLLLPWPALALFLQWALEPRRQRDPAHTDTPHFHAGTRPLVPDHQPVPRTEHLRKPAPFDEGAWLVAALRRLQNFVTLGNSNARYLPDCSRLANI